MPLETFPCWLLQTNQADEVKSFFVTKAAKIRLNDRVIPMNAHS